MPIIVLVFRLALSLLFLIAGASKFLSGLANFRKSLTDFGVTKPLVAPASFALPSVELSIALLLLLTPSAQVAAWAGLTLLILFNVAVATNLVAGRKPQCNCFGQLNSKPIGWSTFVRNCVLALIAGWVAWEIPLQTGINPLELIQRLSARDIADITIALLLFGGIAAEGFALLHVLRQNGRLLLRIEALEAKVVSQPQVQARPALNGLPVGTKAVPFELAKVSGGRVSLDSLLDAGNPVLLISTDPNCGPCNALMPEVAVWQKSLSSELKVVLLSHGKLNDNKSKVAEYGLDNVLLEKGHEIAEKYHATGTPTAVLIRRDGTIGSPAIGGADAIRQLVTNKAWTETGFASFMSTLGYPPPSPAPKPAVPIGSKAPEFVLPDLDGNRVSSSTFNGTGTVLLFWNPQCSFCQRMLEDLKHWESSRANDAPRLMLVSAGTKEANRSMGLQSTVLIDDGFQTGRLYGASGTPSAIRIDGDGSVASGVAVGAPSVLELLNCKGAR